MNSWEAFYGPNVGYALELYERYQQDPASVDPETRAFFEQMGQLGDIPSATAALARPATRTATSKGPASNGHGAPASSAPVADKGDVSPNSGNGAASANSTQPGLDAPPAVVGQAEVAKIVAAARLARSIREYGHLAATINPLGGTRPGDPMLNPRTHGITDDDLRRLPATIVWPKAGPEAGTCLDAMNRLRAIYSGSSGYEFDHVQDYDERAWLHAAVENGTYQDALSAEQRIAVLARLSEVEGFERFLHTVFQGQKRFSLEGNDTLVPMLDEIVREATVGNAGEVLIGMAHRGRLNVLAHVLDKPYAAIFAEFHTAARQEGFSPEQVDSWVRIGGDVKYHRGAHRPLEPGGGTRLELTLADNPSHLEFVNPVVQGFTRAAQDERSQSGPPRQDSDRALAVTVHGDAAFPGEGVVAETLNLSRLPGYNTGGSMHIIVNNQIGFTTVAEEGRSTLYASDLAKGYEIPIIHVNADDPEACLAAVRLGTAYRRRFHRDFLIDLVGYRRWGHNEGDEPSFTQPELYAEIGRQPTARAVYAARLQADGVISAEQAEAMDNDVQARLRAARDSGEGKRQAAPPVEPPPTTDTSVETGVAVDQLRMFNEALLARGEDFGGNSKLERLLGRRREALDREDGIDWAHAEALAFASILAGGTPIRLAGQDTERGTFSQRHLVLHATEHDREYVPLQHLPQARASFAVYNSPLTEAAVLGFEYGYSVHAPETLVLWEAQYGDFANAGQVVIDQFIVAARSKWQQQPALCMLLPHGYEGQGPEHSSARLERYLQLAADGNMRVTYPTTAAQYFHLLRRQAATLSTDRRPLIVMTPKSLLRRAEASSSLAELATGGFQTVLVPAPASNDPKGVTRLVLCSGKVAIDLQLARPQESLEWVAVGRIEQFYPFPETEVQGLLRRYPKLKEVVWVQEEPENMGAWSFIAPYLRPLLAGRQTLRYIGRPARASTAVGSPDIHRWEQEEIVRRSFESSARPRIETQGDQDVD